MSPTETTTYADMRTTLREVYKLPTRTAERLLDTLIAQYDHTGPGVIDRARIPVTVADLILTTVGANLILTSAPDADTTSDAHVPGLVRDAPGDTLDITPSPTIVRGSDDGVLRHRLNSDSATYR